jgi:hypothetical protein
MDDLTFSDFRQKIDCLFIEMNITGIPPTGNLKTNLKAIPSLFTHAKSYQSVNHDMCVWRSDLASRNWQFS